MKSFETNKTIWSDIYKSGKNNLNYPNENLVRYLYYVYPDKNFTNLKVLDYGFGSGNNLRHLDALNFDVYGLEVSENAKELTLEKLRDDFDSNKLFIMHQETVMPYEKESFDLIIAWQVLYYNSTESLEKVLNSIKRLLKPGGKFIATMARKEDVSFINSTPINKYERIMNETTGNQSGSMIIGIPGGEEDIHELFGIFSNIQIGYFETKLNNTIGSHWVIYGEKKHG